MRFVSRSAAGLRPPRRRTALSPTFGTTIHYEGPSIGSFPHASCASKVRGIQNFHMDSRGWSDAAYSAIVCPHGYVFELRWIGVRTGANGTNPGNAAAYAICALIGQGDPMPAVMVEAIAELCQFFRSSGRAGARVNGHRDWKPTACPGDPLYHQVQIGRFLRGGSVPTEPEKPTIPNPTTEEQELMSARDDILAEIQEAKNGTIAYLARVVADTEARLNDRIDRAGAAGAAVRDDKSGRVYVVTASGKLWVQPDELNFLALIGEIQRWPGFPDRRKIPAVDAKYLDGLPEDAELKAAVAQLADELKALAPTDS